MVEQETDSPLDGQLPENVCVRSVKRILRTTRKAELVHSTQGVEERLAEPLSGLKSSVVGVERSAAILKI